MSKIQKADELGKIKLFLKDGNILVGQSYGIEYEEDDDGNETNVEMLAFVPTFMDNGFYLKEEQIDKVEMA